MKILIFLLLYIQYCNVKPSTAQKQAISVNEINRVVYFVDYGDKKYMGDSIFYYSIDGSIQISFNSAIPETNLEKVIIEKLSLKKLADSVFVGSDFVYLNDLQKNDTTNYSLIHNAIKNCIPIRRSQKNTKILYPINKDTEYISAEVVKGTWVEIVIDIETAENILGRTFQLIDPRFSKCHLFVLKNQSE